MLKLPLSSQKSRFVLKYLAYVGNPPVVEVSVASLSADFDEGATLISCIIGQSARHAVLELLLGLETNVRTSRIFVCSLRRPLIKASKSASALTGAGQEFLSEVET
jgi:hypothetical protein